MCLQMENYPNDMTKVLYDEYQFGNSCDLVIKTGLEKHESFCHKIVLAFSSDFLRQLLSSITPGMAPVLLLPDIDSEIIDYLMVFMYLGQVRIPTEQYADFIDACKVLQLKGMSWDDEDQELIEDHVEESSEVLQTHETLVEEVPDKNTETKRKRTFLVDERLEEDSDLSGTEDIELDEMVTDYIEDDSDATIFEVNQPTEASHSKVRLKSGYLQDPFDATKVFPLPKASKRKFLPDTPVLTLKRAQHIRDPQQKIALNESNMTIIRQKLITAIMNVYKDLDFKLKDVQLVVKENRLQKGIYHCSLCDKMISVVYTVDKKGKFRQWVNSNLKRHIIRAHSKEGK